MTPLSSREKMAGLLIGVVLLTGIGPAQAVDKDGPTGASWPSTIKQDGLLYKVEAMAGEEELERQQRELDRKLEEATEQELRLQIVAKALTYVGRVPYVKTGSTPSGWDCSGFTRYIFGKFDIELEHSAGAQKRAGFITFRPQPGDLIAFDRGKGIEHIGIYVGNDIIVESTIETRTTRAVKISDAYPPERGWKLMYTDVIQSNLL